VYERVRCCCRCVCWAPLQSIGVVVGVCVGPLYNPYDYNSRSGAVAALVDFQTDATQCCGTDLQQSLDKHCEEMGPGGGDTAVLTRAYFSGGGRFVMDTEHDGRVKVLSRYSETVGLHMIKKL